MSLRLTRPTLPLRVDADGVVRVGTTRVTLDTVIGGFNEGHEAEEIAGHYPVLGLADVYGTIAYYLQHQAEVDVYLTQRRTEGEALRRTSEELWDPLGVRERLLRRRRASG